jgi:hypothetical protein
MKTIEIISKKHGKHFLLIDDDDFEKVSKYKWCISKNDKKFYVLTNVTTNNKQKKLYIHRYIMSKNNIDNLLIDHINHNTLDNRKQNLRVVTPTQNCNNTSSRTGSTSVFLGVSWYEREKHWRTQITVNKKASTVGTFKDEIEAAKAYNKAAIKHFGEYANLNKI